MESIIKKINSNKFLFSVFIISVLSFSACKVTFVPKYDGKIAEQIELVSKSVDKLYLTMLETTTEADGGRAYDKFAEQYIDIDIELHSLLNKNKARKGNEETIRICESVIEMFDKYKNNHKNNNTISDAIIKLNLVYLRGILYPLAVAEEAKKMSENNK
ncbi:MAG TPA: hypothetical protein DD434_14820 [Bacteroidales bacterium]|nr:hypothetical protein [Bacteroidales bacterium]